MSEPQIRPFSETSQARNQLAHVRPVDVPVEIGLDGEDGYPHKGHLDYASPQVDFATGTLTAARAVRKQGSRSAAGPVRAGADADRASGQSPDGQGGIIGTSQEGSYLLVVNADNVVERRVVKTGVRQGQFRIIESGLDLATGW